MGYNNSYRKDKDMPVTNITYNEILIFLEKLSSYLNIQFRLPTEWEWEYAAKEGKSADYTLYSGSDDIESVAWYYTNSFKMLNYSGMKVANSLGIFDMTGNVMEVCDGYYTQYTSEEKTNPRVESGSLRVTRGGGWNSQRTNCRSTYRFCINDDSSENNVGFRIVMPAQ
jgi:formylglycine-generating enzyme required for sulfatase activity